MHLIHLLVFLLFSLGHVASDRSRVDKRSRQGMYFEVSSSNNVHGRRILTINGHNNSYGPLIRINSGDTINLNLKNSICSPEEVELSHTDPLWKDYCATALHFHGLVPIGNENDGVPGLTQPNIYTGEDYWYNFTIPKGTCGTFWYHSHSTVQYGDGLRGTMIVECPEFKSLANKVFETLTMDEEIITGPLNFDYEGLDKNQLTDSVLEEHVITLADWYDNFDLEVLHDRVLTYDGTTDPAIDGSLINGLEDNNLEFTMNEATEALLLRIINTGISGTQIFHVAGHKLVIMETDGVLVKPYVVETLSLAVGQRYTVIVKLSEEVKSGRKGLRIINGCNKMMGYIEKTAWFLKSKYKSVKDESSIRVKNLPGLTKNELFRELEPIYTDNSKGLWEDEEVQRITLDYSYHRDDETKERYGTGMYKVNGKTFDEYFTEPLLVKGGHITEIIINSIDHMRHPWHLHGQSFQVVSIGEGHEGPLRMDFLENDAGRKYERDVQYWKDTGKTPMTRDSINVPGSSYVAIRIKADAPGLWPLHCHVDWHMAKGLGVVLKELAQDTDSVTEDAPPKHVYDPKDSQQPLKHRIRVLIIYFFIMVGINAILYRLLISN